MIRKNGNKTKLNYAYTRYIRQINIEIHNKLVIKISFRTIMAIETQLIEVRQLNNFTLYSNNVS